MSSKRALLFTTPNSYRTQDYVDAAERSGIDCVVAVDLPKTLAEEWNFPLGADFGRPDQAAKEIVAALANRGGSEAGEVRFDAVLALDDSGARVARAGCGCVGPPHNDPMAAEAARIRFQMRTLLAACGAPVPTFGEFRTSGDT